MPRDERGRFTKNDGMSIQLPPLPSMLKYLLISIVLYPWYYVFMKSGKVDMFMGNIFPVKNAYESETLGNSGTLATPVTPANGNSASAVLTPTEQMMGSAT